MALIFDMPSEGFEKLTTQEAQFYHDIMPWALVTLGLPGVSPLTIPHILARNEMLRVFTIPPHKGLLEKLIGMKINVAFETNRQFTAKVQRDLPKGSVKDGEKMYAEIRELNKGVPS